MTIKQYLEDNKYDLIPDYKLGLELKDTVKDNLEWSKYHLTVSYTNTKLEEKEVDIIVDTLFWGY